MKSTLQPSRVIWTEGLLIAPQHLQQQDIFHEQHLEARLAAMHPYPWGVSEMVLDHAAISGGNVRLLGFHGIFPDGTVLQVDTGDVHIPPARNIAENFTGSTSTVDVHLCLYSHRDGLPNYDGIAGIAPQQDEKSGESRTRFRAVSRRAFDQTSASNELAVELGVPAPVLRFGNEMREEFVSIKIGEVLRTSAGGYKYAPEYVPPSTAVAASDTLQKFIRDIHTAAIGRHRELSEQRRQRDSASVEFEAKDITRYLFLSAIAGNLPSLAHLSVSPETHPLSAYLLLARFCGLLSPFSPDLDPGKLPAYQHSNLHATFEPLTLKILDVLGGSLQENFIRIPLEPRKDGLWLGRLKDERLVNCTRYILAIETDLPEREVASRVPGLSKIASWNEINKIVSAATPGVPLRAIHRPPDEIPIRPKQVYFTMDTNDRYFREIANEKAIAIYVPPPMDPSRAQLILMAIPEGKKG